MEPSHFIWLLLAEILTLINISHNTATMNIFRFLLFSTPLLLLTGCYDQERETRLTQRERSLLVREKQFAMKESEYLSLLKMRDSLLALQDTMSRIVAWPEEISGTWNSKVICIESNCPEYIVGDQRNDTWMFASDSTRMIVKVINNNRLIRVYNSSFNEKAISLTFRTDSLASKHVEMSVLLHDLGQNKIRGVRTLSIDDQCAARFSVELSRNPDKEQL